MQVQWLECVGNVNQALAFWDTGSNVNLVRKQFAEMAGWKGLPVFQQLQTTWRGGEDWHITAYWVTLVDRQDTEHNLLFFEIDTITADMAPVDVTSVLGLFGGAVSEISHFRRPTGAVDMLIGINYAGLFPVVADSNAHREGNLRLLTSKFGTGMLLDGTHQTLRPGVMRQDEETFKRSHASWTTKYVKAPKKVVN